MQLSLEWSRELGERGIRRAASNAERFQPGFTRHAAAFMLACLARGDMSGEDLTDAARRAGYCPPDDRAFGAVFRAILRGGARVVGTCPRRKGHGSAGGKVYGVARCNAAKGPDSTNHAALRLTAEALL